MRAIGKKSVCYLVILALILSAFFSVPVYRVKAAVPVTGITLAVTDFEMTLSANLEDTITWPNNYWTITPEDATNKRVSVKSSNTKVVTADSTDSNKICVEAVGVGTATVTVTTEDGGYTASCKITVKGPKVSELEWIDFPGNSGGVPYIQVGTTHSTKVAVNVIPSNANDQRVEFTSRPAGILSIDSEGNVTALKAGEAYIVATAMDGSGVSIESNKITAWGEEQDILTQSLTWKKNTSSLTIGESYKFEVQFSPENVTNKTLKWSSTIPAYATVDENGTVTAVAPGATTITATAKDGSGKKVNQKLKVQAAEPAVEAVTITASGTTIEKGDSVQMSASVMPSDADQSVTWTSSSTSVATVSSTGLVSAVGAGSATITATSTKNTNINKSIAITVVITPTGITLSSTSATLEKDETLQLSSTVAPTGADQSVSWESSNENVATVSSTGLVTAVGAGSAMITATSTKKNTVSKSATITVTETPEPDPTPTGITLSDESATIEKGESKQLNATVQPSEADQSVVWTSSNENVATVNSTGLVTAVGAGSATITATSTKKNTVSKSASITVTEAPEPDPTPTGITLSDESATIEKGETKQLNATVLPSDADQSVTWESSNESVATVSNTGLVTAVGAGSATITATSTKKDTVSKSATITVTETPEPDPTPTGITLSDESATIEKGETKQLNATVLPSGADQSVTWTSSNEQIATVSNSGLVTAVGAGRATITAKSTKNTDVSKSAAITVTVSVNGIDWTNPANGTTQLTLEKGGEYAFEAVVTPQDADETGVTYSSSNPSVLKIDPATGNAEALSGGDAEVTALSIANGSIKTNTVKVHVTVPVSAITISDCPETIKVGDKASIEYRVDPEDAENGSVSFEVSQQGIVSISHEGEVTGLAEGTVKVKISATDGSGVCSEEKTIRVEQGEIKAKAVDKIDIDQSSFEMKVGDEDVKLTATVSPADATDQNIIWDSSDATVVAVSAAGIVKAVGKGQAQITARSYSDADIKSESITVTVSQPVTSVKWTDGTSTDQKLDKGEKLQLKAVVEPDDADNKELVWSSSKKDVATVENGVVTAIGGGETVISVSSKENSSIKATMKVSVRVPLKDVKLDKTELKLKAGESATVKASVEPADTTENTDIVWNTDNADVATVSNGKITAVKSGKAVITAENKESKKSASVTVTVDPILVENITIANTKILMQVGQSNQSIQWSVSPETAELQTVRFTSSNPNVVAVDTYDGTLLAKNPGTAKITVTAADGGGASATAEVTVTEPVKIEKYVEAINLEKTELVIPFGDTAKITATVSPSDASYQGLAYVSADNAIAMADGDGNVSAVSVGSTTINVLALDNDGKINSTVFVTVEPRDVASLTATLSKTSYIYTGSACKPTVTVKYGDTVLERGKDYTLTYAKYIKAGTATVTVNGIGNYTGSKVLKYTIKTRSVGGTTITKKLKNTSMMYTGKALKPAVTVKYGTTVLKKGTDYTVTYSKNVKVGTASVVIKGKGNYGGSKKLTFKITKRAITAAKATTIAAKKYTGKAIKPLPVLKYNGKTLKRGTDYKLTYKNNVKVGTATIVVTGIGNFKGTRKITFKIKK